MSATTSAMNSVARNLEATPACPVTTHDLADALREVASIAEDLEWEDRMGEDL